MCGHIAYSMNHLAALRWTANETLATKPRTTKSSVFHICVAHILDAGLQLCFEEFDKNFALPLSKVFKIDHFLTPTTFSMLSIFSPSLPDKTLPIIFDNVLSHMYFLRK